MKPIIYILILLCFSCTQRKETWIQSDFPIKEISFSLDNETPNLMRNSQYHLDSNGEENVFFWNDLNNTLYKYNLELQELTDKYPMQLEGPNGIGNSTNFLYLNQDSIFFSEDQALQIFRTNLENTQTEKFSVFRYDKNKRGSIPHVHGHSPMIFKENSLHLLTPFTYSPFSKYAPNEYKEIKNSRFNVWFSLKNNTLYTDETPFPAEYQRGIFSPYQYFISQTLGPNNSIIYSFFLSDSVFVKNNDNEFTSYLAKSNFNFPNGLIAKSVENLSEDSENIFFKSFLEAINYETILYDKFRNVYYRFVEFPITLEERNIELNERTKPIGIIILDQDFNKIKEVNLGYGKYLSVMAFVSNQGLNIYNYEKNSRDESKLHFDLFDFGL